MSYQKYSGEVNLDHPVIEECPDGTVRMYFHELPPILLKDPIILSEQDLNPPEDQTTD